MYDYVKMSNGGFVRVEAEPGGTGTEIDVQSQEWSYDVKRFLSQF
jgi:hypothetical protein